MGHVVPNILSKPIYKENDMEFFDDGKTKFYIDYKEETAEVFNDYYFSHDVGWAEEVKDGTVLLTIYRDDAR